MTTATPHATPFPRFTLLGSELACVSVDAAAEWIVEAALAHSRGHVCAANVHTATLGFVDPTFRACINASLFSVTDGMPLVWAGRLLGAPATRAFGPELMAKVFELGRRAALRHALLGGDDALLGELASALEARFPGARIVSRIAPPMRDAGDPAWRDELRRIAETEPHVLWVGLGAPKQERIMARYAAELPFPMVGVGYAFALHAGRKRRAPAWMQTRGLEWLFRLGQEPRLLGRYALYNSIFLATAPFDVARQRLARWALR